MNTQLDWAKWLAQGDTVSHTVLMILLTMSVVSWSVLLWQGWQGWRASLVRRQWKIAIEDAQTLPEHIDIAKQQEGFADSNVLLHALHAAHAWKARRSEYSAFETDASPRAEDLVIRAMQHSINQSVEAQGRGLTALATIASAAPFVGLLGTVWGIIHALLALGAGGPASLDRVAGPVGEALVMTAIGLAVAIPAAVGYNILARGVRRVQAQLEETAHNTLMLPVWVVAFKHLFNVRKRWPSRHIPAVFLAQVVLRHKLKSIWFH
jgi:biopolymer transport protein ExbB